VYEVSHISRRVKWFSTENLGAPNGGDPGPILPPGQERTPYGDCSGTGSVCDQYCTGSAGVSAVRGAW
jgi:hypothetical protein